jgi:Flp pilus assembly secretin CpaC
MKALYFCVLLTLPVAAYAQQPAVEPFEPAPNQIQPDTSGLRLQQLLHNASELQRTGQREQAAAVLQEAETERQRLQSHLDTLQNEVDRVRKIVGVRPQVLVHLQVFEVSLTKLRQLGFDMSKLPTATAATPAELVKNAGVGSSSVVMDGTEARRFFDALRKDNLARVLAEPSLTAINGQEAKFRSGGRFPFPKEQKDGSTTIDWQDYGTEVQLTPEVLGNSTVRLAIRCKISELDYTAAAKAGKNHVPGIQGREFSTHTELQNGQSLLFTGLTQTRVESENSGLPVIGDIPYAGAVFRHVKETRNEVAMFVLICPEIIEPSGTMGQAISIPPSKAGQPAGVDVRAMAGRPGSIMPTVASRPNDNSGRR